MKNFFLSILLLVLLLDATAGYGQNVASGIYTTNPQQTLHVAGNSNSPGTDVGTTTIKLVTPTVRVDGLNSANNPAHNPSDGTSSLRRVYANANGDLVLVNGSIEQLTPVIQEFNTIPSQAIATTAGLGKETPVALITRTFVLKQPSVVNISATVGVTVQPAITDGTAKLYGAYFRFSAVPAGSNISTAANFGMNEKTYANQVSAGVTGDFMVSPRADLVLPAGTYTVALYGYIHGGNTPAFSVTFGNTNGENVIITASPQLFQ